MGDREVRLAPSCCRSLVGAARLPYLCHVNARYSPRYPALHGPTLPPRAPTTTGGIPTSLCLAPGPPAPGALRRHLSGWLGHVPDASDTLTSPDSSRPDPDRANRAGPEYRSSGPDNPIHRETSAIVHQHRSANKPS